MVGEDVDMRWKKSARCSSRETDSRWTEETQEWYVKGLGANGFNNDV